MTSLFESDRRPTTLADKVTSITWPLILLIGILVGIGIAVLYSAADGNVEPWAARSALRFGIGLVLLLGASLIDIRVWHRAAYPIYGLSLVLVVLVDLHGVKGLGAQRWIELGPLSVQPSELMKIGLVMALARYFGALSLDEIGRPWRLVVPALMVLVPAALVLKQPDLGTAAMLVLGGLALFFLAGVRWWKFVLVAAAAGAVAPLTWRFLKDYQKRRLLIFLNPEQDSLGAGYHITESKIALGSGGLWGKGFLQGTQSHLSFLPEKHTDFIFTTFAEEFGMVGGLALLALYAAVIAYGAAIALRSRTQFGRLLALGVVANLFLYAFINIAMVMGVVPVVGVPLPLISYGGTALLALMFCFGLVISVWVHRDVMIR